MKIIFSGIIFSFLFQMGTDVMLVIAAPLSVLFFKIGMLWIWKEVYWLEKSGTGYSFT